MPEFVKIVGTPSDESTTQTHELELPNGANLSFLVTIHKNEPPMGRMEAIRAVVNFIHHEASAAELSFEDWKKVLTQTVSTPPFDCVVLYEKDSLLYAFVVGNTQVFISRKGKLSPLLQGGKSLKGASGYLQDGDCVVALTEKFLSCTSTEELAGYTFKRQFEQLEQDVTTRIEKSEDSGSVGVLFLNKGPSAPSIEEDEKIEQEEPVKQDPQETEEIAEALEEHTTVNPPIYFADEKPPLRQRFFKSRDNAYEAHGRSTKLAVVGIVLIVFLGVSIFFGAKAKKSKAEVANVKSVIISAQEALNQAKSLANVNKVEARDLILNAREQVLGVHTEAAYPELAAMNEALTESLGDVAGVYEVKPNIFSDLTLISKDTTADDIALSDNVVRVLSKEEKRVLTIELPGKRTHTLSGTSILSLPTAIEGYANRTFVVDNGLYEFGQTQKKQFDLPGSADDIIMRAFAGNIYILQKSANTIWRYPGAIGGFGEKNNWLASSVEVDFLKAKSVSIDGAIWVLFENGKLTKFMLGNPQNVNLQGLPSPLSDKSVFYTNDTAQDMYVLDPTQKSIFVFEKNGSLVATYQNEQLGSVNNIVVSEENEIMILSAGNKLLSIPTKHLK